MDYRITCTRFVLKTGDKYSNSGRGGGYSTKAYFDNNIVQSVRALATLNNLYLSLTFAGKGRNLSSEWSIGRRLHAQITTLKVDQH
jgi:hypothetical protein